MENPSTARGIDVAYVARLARLRLDERERALLQGQLEDILEYVNALREVDVSGIEPMTQAIDAVNVVRGDEVEPGLDRDEVLANAPRARLGQFIVPRIIE